MTKLCRLLVTRRGNAIGLESVPSLTTRTLTSGALFPAHASCFCASRPFATKTRGTPSSSKADGSNDIERGNNHKQSKHEGKLLDKREKTTKRSDDKKSVPKRTSRPQSDIPAWSSRSSDRSSFFGLRRGSSQSTTTKSSLPKDIRELVGQYKKTTITQSEIRDSYGQLILQPPQMSSKHLISLSTTTPAGNDTRDNGSLPSFQSLPLLNASALLDSKHYIKASANASTSRSGTESARRLLRARKEWMQTIRKHAERGLNPPPSGSSSNGSHTTSKNNNSFVDRRRAAYRLTGHGVPPQLLQNHVDFAGALMAKHDATSLAFPSKDWMRIRKKDGSHETLPMMEEDDDHAFMLYLAVMERMTRTLSIVLHRGPILTSAAPPRSESTTAARHHNNASAGYIEQVGKTTTSFSSKENQPQNQDQLRPIWHVELTRGWAVAEPLVQNQEQVELEPVVEWIWPRQICIRLRGRTSDSNMAVALAYDATSPQLQDWRT